MRKGAARTTATRGAREEDKPHTIAGTVQRHSSRGASDGAACAAVLGCEGSWSMEVASQFCTGEVPVREKPLSSARARREASMTLHGGKASREGRPERPLMVRDPRWPYCQGTLAVSQQRREGGPRWDASWPEEVGGTKRAVRNSFGGSLSRSGDGEGVKVDGLASSREGVAHWLHLRRRPRRAARKA